MPCNSIGKGRVEDVARHRAEADLVGNDLAGERHAHEGAAVEAAGKGDDRLASGRGAGDLDGVFDSLRTGGHEDRLLGEVAGGQCVQALGEVYIGFVGNDLMAGMREAIELRFDRFDDLRVTMTRVDDGNPGGEVDVAIALLIPDFRVFRAIGINLGGHADATGNGGILAVGKAGHGAFLLRLESICCIFSASLFWKWYTFHCRLQIKFGDRENTGADALFLSYLDRGG
jgi:hypothetical protein